MSTTTTVGVVGTPRDRVDGRLKVMGAATYPIDVTIPGLAHAVLVQSTVTSGRVRHIAVDAAERAPGVLAIITHVNAPALAHGADDAARSVTVAAAPKRRHSALRPARGSRRRGDQGAGAVRRPL